MNSDKSNLIGMVDHRTDVKVGDLIQARAIEGQSRAVVAADAHVVEDHGPVVEVLVTHTIEVESVDNINGFLWCKGPITETNGRTAVGRVFPVYLGEVA